MDMIKTVQSKKSPKNILKGSINRAIEKAERFNTQLVIQDKDGRVKRVTPAQMRRILSKGR